MRLFHSIHWRVTLAYTAALVVGVIAAVVLAIIVFDYFRARALLGAAGVVLALSPILVFFVSRRQTRSLRLIVQAAQRLASGDLGHRVHAVATDETRELAEALNRITQSLQQMGAEYADEHNTMSAVLATMTDGVAVVDSEGRVALSNPASHDLLGLRVSEEDGRRFVEMVRDHELQRILAECRRTGESQYAEIELTGSRHYLSAIAAPLRVQAGEPTAVLLVLHDLTQEQRVETTRREFVGNVSHELRTPLASIKAAVETLGAGALDQKELAGQFLAGMGLEVDRMSRLVEELLELSRLETGQAGLNLGVTSIATSVQQATEQHSEQAEARGVSMEVHLPADLPPVVGDEEKLRQVVSNLVENGIKFTTPGGTLAVSLVVREEEVEVAVSDTGIGIPPDRLPHVFERFYKVDQSRRDEGTGLGLAIAKHIVQSHQGRIWVESREGEGSTFFFTVPRAL